MLLKEKEKEPELGDYKFTYHFAWLPVMTDNGKIWLERYKRVYEYRHRKRYVGYPFSITVECPAWDLIATQRMNNDHNSKNDSH